MDINELPSDADNYDVWCERCQRVHPYYTMTREKMAGIITDGARALEEEIDRRASEYAYRKLYGDQTVN